MQGYREINYLDGIRAAAEHLQHGGVFLNVGGETPNTMTIGWASIGYMWKKPVFTVLVRPQRHSYDMLIRAGEFTVSVPLNDELRRQLAFAGTASGRDVNKFEGHGLTALPAKGVSAPIVAECGLHFECKTRLVQPMTPEQMDPELISGIYAAGDYHIMFFGEIISCNISE